MKTTFKLSLGNIIGAVAKAVPELKELNLGEIDGDNIVIEGSTECTLTELAGAIKLMPEVVDTLAETFRKVLKYEEEFSSEESDVKGQLRSAVAMSNEYIKLNKRLADIIDTKNKEIAYFKEKLQEQDRTEDLEVLRQYYINADNKKHPVVGIVLDR